MLLASAPGVYAQTMDTRLSIHVSSLEGDNLEGQPISLLQSEWQIGYGNVLLDEEGNASLKVYAGPHTLTIDREGFNHLEYPFTVEEGEKEKNIEVTLTEKTRDPFALKAVHSHDAYTGKDLIDFSWNVEPPVFFDDFESYTPFAITFGDWTGIDADSEMAAPLVGNYNNRGVMQYAQIINPMTVVPTWWYEYPVLRPYSGNQYVGFTRTNSGNANDDWLISPEITPGTENVLSFMAKAADRYEERFMVYITTKTENPTQADFTRLDEGNYEGVTYDSWKQFTYDLSKYAGTPVKFAIRYVSHAARYGAFMLMVDDVYVGQRDTASAMKSRRVARSPYNAYEKFNIYLDGKQIGTTDGYNYSIEDAATGKHTLGVEAIYRAEKSKLTEIETEVPSIDYAKVDFTVSAKSLLEPDVLTIGLLSLDGDGDYTLTTAKGKASVISLPPGRYAVNIDEGAYMPYNEEIEINGDKAVEIELTDQVNTPYNLTSSTTDDGIMLRWNRALSFFDSFEDYDDFATGSFGDWKTIDKDGMPVYPIGLGSATNIVKFPGSGSDTNPMPVAPMVFNPYMTEPPMLPTDPAIAALTGDKSVIFFSPQMAQADKWLISPLIEINKNYVLSVKAKAYSIYPETMEFCISDGSDNPIDFEVLAETGEMPSSNWMDYRVPLDPYEGQTVRLAVHYTSVDAFLAQVDDFTVGPADGDGDVVDYGNILHFEIYLDGKQIATTETPEYLFSDLAEGEHTLGVIAVYKESKSEMAELKINVSGIGEIEAAGAENVMGIYDVNGRAASADAKGVLIIKTNKGFRKVIR